jgi:hypothetical protein
MIEFDNKEIEITKEQAEEILGENCIERMRIGEITIRCNNCGPIGPITDMTTDRYILNDLNDVILEGTCNNCHARIARYFETGEVGEYKQKAIEVWNDLQKQ